MVSCEISILMDNLFGDDLNNDYAISLTAMFFVYEQIGSVISISFLFVAVFFEEFCKIG